MRFSIIIPAYNAEKYIERAINSVLNQTFQDFEIIVINDASVDNTAELVENLAKKNKKIKLINLKENKGQGAARNIGIKKARGEFIAFLDADDLWFSNKLENIEKKFRETNADLICHDVVRVRKGNKKVWKCGPYKDYKSLLFKKNCIFTSATVVRKSKLFDVGMFSEDKEILGFEDYDLWLRLSKIAKFVFVHETLGIYNADEGYLVYEIKRTLKHYLNFLNTYFKGKVSIGIVLRKLRVFAWAMKAWIYRRF